MRSVRRRAAALRARRLPPGQLLLLLAVALVSLAMAAPLVWMLLGSVRTNEELLRAPFDWPAEPHWRQWAQAWEAGRLDRAAWNSMAVTVLSVSATVLLGAAAAFPPARSNRGGPILGLYLIGLIVPAQAAAVPTFLLLRSLRLLDTWWALILPYTAWGLPLAVFLFYGFFRSQSREPEEAALLDGCSMVRVFWCVTFPIARPAAGVVALLTALGTWNEFLFALLFIHSDEVKTVPPALLAFSSAHTTDYGLTLAALCIVSLPLLAAYLFMQRALIQGSAEVLA